MSVLYVTSLLLSYRLLMIKIFCYTAGFLCGLYCITAQQKLLLKKIKSTTVWFVMTKWFTAKCPYGKKSHGKVSLRRSDLIAKCPYGELSSRQNVRTAKGPYGEMSYQRFILRQKVLRRKVPPRPNARNRISFVAKMFLNFDTPWIVKGEEKCKLGNFYENVTPII